MILTHSRGSCKDKIAEKQVYNQASSHDGEDIIQEKLTNRSE